MICILAKFDQIILWQHFGNKKSVSQNNMCNRDKNKAFFTQNLNKNI